MKAVLFAIVFVLLLEGIFSDDHQAAPLAESEAADFIDSEIVFADGEEVQESYKQEEAVTPPTTDEPPMATGEPPVGGNGTDEDHAHDKEDLQNALKSASQIKVNLGHADQGAKEITLEKQSVKVTEGKTIIITIPPEVYKPHGTGVSYTRWGKKACPTGAELLYRGYTASGHYNHFGNGANYICLPRQPQYMSNDNLTWSSYLYGTEYETYNDVFYGTTQNYNVPCAVCYVPNRSTQIMIPARVICPGSWTLEYYGYLMTSYYGHRRNAVYECVDMVPDVIPGSAFNGNGALFYFVEAVCTRDGLPCDVYHASRAVTCAVCTK